MIGLTKLRMNECQISCTKALKLLVNLVELSLDRNEGIDIISIQYLTKLTKLSLRKCNLDSLDALRPLKKLKVLNIYGNKIVNLYPLVDLKQISQLDARKNKIIDFQAIQQHQHFNRFYLKEQEQPTQEEQKTANTMRLINDSIGSQKYIYKQSIYSKSQCNTFRIIIAEIIKKQYENHSKFDTLAMTLFKQMNE
ncbi:Conserved_hypothetical protein [Hexamita inflata]|uniref:Uncharacterized protein n=1 Tax=Hexamita inflata TaxID=28002 RepID=A0AA86TMY1_9EUKA|nr:Conserved hypothetical protein [Hexamita inflata]